MTMISPSFKIYARKPNQAEDEKVEKRKLNEPCEGRKKMKEEESSHMGEFSVCLDQLLNITSKMNDQDKQTASAMIVAKFFQ